MADLVGSSIEKAAGKISGSISTETKMNVAGAIIGGVLAQNVTKAIELAYQGVELYNSGDMNGALATLDKVIGKSSYADGIALAMKGYIHFKQGDNNKAFAAYKKAISSRASDKQYAHVFRSELYASIGDTDNAAMDCCEALNGTYNESYNWAAKTLPDYLNLAGNDISGFEKRCFPLIKAAAEKGDKRAYAGLAECYDQGYGTSKNEQEAKKWFALSAQVGYPIGIIITKGHTFSTTIAASLRVLLYSKSPLIFAILLGALTFFLLCIPGIIVGWKFGRHIMKKIQPGAVFYSKYQTGQSGIIGRYKT